MNKRIMSVIFASIFALICFYPNVSNAFHHNTRVNILNDAIQLSPDHLKSYLQVNYDIIASGMFFADRHHRFRINPEDTADIYKTLVNRLKEGRLDEYNTIHTIGVLACFVSQTIHPKPFNIQDEFAPSIVKYDGLDEVEDIDTRVSDLITIYRNPYYNSTHKEARDYLYNVAVNEIVDLWVCAWKAAGNNTSGLCAVGTEIDRVRYAENTSAGVNVKFHPGAPYDLAYIYDTERKVWVLVSGAERTVNGIPYRFVDETGQLFAAGTPVSYNTVKN